MTGPSIARRLGAAYRSAVTRGAWVVIVLWIAAAAAVTVLVPTQGGTGDDFGDLLPTESTALQAQQRSLELFRIPAVGGTAVVLHDPEGLSLLTRADSLLWALSTTERALEDPERSRPGQLIAAIPVPTGSATTTVTSLYASEGTGVWPTVVLANQYAAHFSNQPVARAYVTGSLPAQIAQGDYLSARLPLFEAASVLLILVIVTLAFRSLLAPLTVLSIAAVGYLVYFPVMSELVGALGYSVPDQLTPVLLALLLGVVTDYCVLLFAAYRDGADADPAAHPGELTRRALGSTASVVFVAGLTVIGGTLALFAAPLAIFQGLAPALALTVLVGLAVSLTLTPALMRVLGWRLFTLVPVRGSRRAPHLLPERVRQAVPEPQSWVVVLTRRAPAWAAAVGVVAVLALAALPVATTRFDLSFTSALPASDPAAEATQALSDIGMEGLTAPTEVIVEAPGVGGRRAALADLQRGLEEAPGVARVLGPADSPFPDGLGVLVTPSGDAARFVVVYDSDPLGAAAIADVRRLQDALPALVNGSGLAGVTTSVSGQTVIAAEVADLTRASLEITLVVALLIELAILALYLRALLTPIVLLACSALSVASALGLTTLLFQGLLGEEGLTFYAPFASAVLLIALGSDYNVFAVGGVWDEARRRPMRDAIAVAIPRTAHAITVAGAILAATFALVAIIPLSTFRQIAFAMTVGLLLDTLVVRPLLTPAVLTLLGRWAGWPGPVGRVEPPVEPGPEPDPETAPTPATAGRT